MGAFQEETHFLESPHFFLIQSPLALYFADNRVPLVHTNKLEILSIHGGTTLCPRTVWTSRAGSRARVCSAHRRRLRRRNEFLCFPFGCQKQLGSDAFRRKQRATCTQRLDLQGILYGPGENPPLRYLEDRREGAGYADCPGGPFV